MTQNPDEPRRTITLSLSESAYQRLEAVAKYWYADSVSFAGVVLMLAVQHEEKQRLEGP